MTPNPFDPAAAEENEEVGTGLEKQRSLVKTSFRLWGGVGHVFIALIVLTVGAWGFAAPLASGIVTSGYVTVDTNRKMLRHLEGGVVKTLHVRDGSRVEAGETLITLDETVLKSRRDILKTRLLETQVQIARLSAEIEDRDAITLSDEVIDAHSQMAVDRLLVQERRVFEARRLSRKGERDILMERAEQVGQEIIGLEAELASDMDRKEIAGQEHEVVDGLQKKGLVSVARVLTLQRELADIRGNIGRLTASIARSKRSVGEINLQIVQAEKDFQEIVLSELSEANTELKQVKDELAAAENVLQRTTVPSPESGTVVNMAVHAKGAVIRPGDVIMEIVPDRDELLIEVRINPADIDNLTLDSEADVRFTAFKERTTPKLIGLVSYVSADTMMDDRTGQPYYRARIAVSGEEIERLGTDKLAPGMPADVMISTGSRTAVQYLTQPIVDSMNKAWREH
ncbi:MAG: HlyD family type I secretion periplasmic adaptor subunit [Pseudomonadota bacterium]